MPGNLQDSIVLVTSSDPAIAGSEFGTGFIVYHDERVSYIVTCAHVINAVGGAEKILADHTEANLVNSEENIDVAILRVSGLHDRPSLSLLASGEEGTSFVTAGFQLYDKPRYRIRTLHGVLGGQSGVETRDHTYRARSWDLKIIGDYQLQRGYSGSPVVIDNSNCVVGIVTNLEGDGQKGAALSVEAVSYIWHDMPESIFVPTLIQTARSPDPNQRQPLTVKECRELASLLWQCRSMSEPALRDTIVVDLESDFQTSIKRNRNNDLADIRQIVDACEYFNGFTLLKEGMYVYDKNTQSMLAVEHFLQSRLR